MKPESTLIIAEAGVNHNGDLAIGKKLINIAAEAGADLVKFQTFAADRLVARSASKAEYQMQTTDASESQYEMLQELELSLEMHEELIDYCQHCGIGFFSTGFDIQSVEMLSELGLELFKIPSGEINNLPYLRHIGSYGKPVILSTGMSTISEIEMALNILEESGTPREQVSVLHCNTEYPTPMKDVNLKAMISIRDTLGVAVGYSDHTLGIEIPIAAVALGATVIEKHFTLDRTLPGPDHSASLESVQLKAMVAAIRNIEKAMGDGVKKSSHSEIKNIPVTRKSIVAKKPIKKGERFSVDNLTVKRPGIGVSPMKWDEVLSLKSNRNYITDDLISI